MPRRRATAARAHPRDAPASAGEPLPGPAGGSPSGSAGGTGSCDPAPPAPTSNAPAPSATGAPPRTASRTRGCRSRRRSPDGTRDRSRRTHPHRPRLSSCARSHDPAPAGPPPLAVPPPAPPAPAPRSGALPSLRRT